MSEYIERETIRDALYDANAITMEGVKIINQFPVSDVAQVRHGHWIYHPDDLFPNDSTQECSYCHAEESLTLYNENYCPNCGARMDEVIE